MNKITWIIKTCVILLSLPLLMTSCKEDDESYTKYPTPVWQTNHSQFSVSMTAVVKLPSNLERYVQEEDMLSAFAGEECRGVAEYIDGLYYVTIKGTPEDQESIHFVYYNSRNQYLYETKELFTFAADGVFGTITEPEQLTLSIVK